MMAMCDGAVFMAAVFFFYRLCAVACIGILRPFLYFVLWMVS